MKKIDKKVIEDILALTPMQEGLLFHYLKEPGSNHYFQQLNLEMSGEISIDIFKKAWDVVIETNDSLKTVFCWEKVDYPLQIILKQHNLQQRFYDFSDKNSKEKKKLLQEVKIKDRREKFDLGQVPFRITLCKMENDLFEVIISSHHILYDGWSSGIILKEFFNTYDDLSRGKEFIKPVKTKFKAFVKWIQSQDTQKQEKYWRNYLNGFDTRTTLPIKKRENKSGAGVENYFLRLKKSLRHRIVNFGKIHKITLASFMYTAWGLLLQRYTNNDDVVFGTTVAGRSLDGDIPGIEDMVGLFINTIPLRVQTLPGEKVLDLLYRIDKEQQTREAYEHTPLVKIREFSEPDKKQELFHSVVVVENYPLDRRFINGYGQLSVNSYSMVEIPHYNLTISLMMHEDIEFTFTYNREVFDENVIVRLGEYIMRIAAEIVKNTDNKVSDLEIISMAEKRKILNEFNRTSVDFPGERTIQRLFEKQVASTPNKLALVGRWQRAGGINGEILQITYQELDEKSNLMAFTLIEKGIQPGTIVGIMSDRSIEMIIGILGILKSGGAYLPIDPEIPKERINYMLQDSKAKALVVDNSSYASWLSFAPKALLNLSEGHHPNFHPSTLPSFYPSQSSSLAYVIYTSGSTGRPKGVLIEHQSLVNFAKGITIIIDFQESDTILSLTTISFDIFGLETIVSLTKGTQVVIGGKEEQLNAQSTARAIIEKRITILQLTPTRLSIFLSNKRFSLALKLLKKLLVGGETLSDQLLEKAREVVKGKIYNLYGPTETTIWSTVKDLSKGQPLNIGKPIANTKVFILDRANTLQPIGITGELCVSGDGLARGYLNQPELTSEKFVISYFDKFSKVTNDQCQMTNDRLYKTGDLARWLPDGNIEFLGRIDQQVKMRGFRIELEEIEFQLLKHDLIKEAVVIAREEENGEMYLCAYIVPQSSDQYENIMPSELRNYLSQNLPAYMIPSYFIQRESIPLTASGKIDRNSLPMPDIYHFNRDTNNVPPKGTMEKTIAKAWEAVLKIEKPGIHDNFFDLGGNSLKIIRLSSRLTKNLNREIPVITLFKYPTISSLARHLKGVQGNEETLDIKEEKPIPLIYRDIAVIGMSGRFPGARNINEYWNNLKNGIESITFFTEDELKASGVDDETLKNPNYIKAKGIIEKAGYFDASFFNYSPNDATVMELQMRILHECCWEALEDAAYVPDSCEHPIGLYAGASNNFNRESMIQLYDDIGVMEPFEAMQLVDKSFMCTRVSYKLNLKGPSVFVQTACSTSLVAIHMAVNALLMDDCSMSLAGGVNLSSPEKAGYMYKEGFIASSNGHCQTFDAGADGTVGGDGIGIVVLKRLDKAVKDNDHIYAVIKASAVNNDGSRKVGYPAPSVEGQAEAIRQVHKRAGISPKSITYIEAHGTGTVLGDPIEVEALKSAFNIGKKRFCAIGSVKTNIGHLDSAAGAAGFIKTVLALHHKQLPPSLHFKVPNPRLDLENSPFYVNTRLKEWKQGKYPLRAGVSSFGIGGTNAHMVLEEAPQSVISHSSLVNKEKKREREYQLILLSAKTRTALDKMTQNLVSHLKENPGLTLADFAYTLKLGRKVFKHRRMVVCSNVNEAIEALSSTHSNKVHSYEDSTDGHRPRVIFMFSGLGSQYINMGRTLYEEEPVFRGEMDRCFNILESIMGINIKNVLYPTNESSSNFSCEENKNMIHQQHIIQPLMLSFEYALAQLLIKWGIKPSAIIGYSFGEYTAACLSGVFTLEDTLQLVAYRGKLMDKLSPGKMLSVPLTEEELKPLVNLNKELSIAVVNGPSCIVSGPREAMNIFEKELKEKRLICIPLNISYAVHSKMMDPILTSFDSIIKPIKLNQPEIPFISTVTGKWISIEEAANPGYWVRQLRDTVRFADGLEELLKEKDVVFVDIGPGNDLSSIVMQHKARTPDQMVISTIRNRKQNISDTYYLLSKIGQLWLYGQEIKWDEFYKDENRKRLSLPTYPFERQQYNLPIHKIDKAFNSKIKEEIKTDGKKSDIADWFYIPSWKVSILPVYQPNAASKEENWLIFIDDWGLGLQFVKKFQQDNPNNKVAVIKEGDGYSKLNHLEYTINPQEEKDYFTLMNHLCSLDFIPDKIVHFWNVGHKRKDETDTVWYKKNQERGFYSLLFLAKVIGREVPEKQILFSVVSNNMQGVSGDDLLYPEKSLLLGPVRTIPIEYSNMKCRSIDIVINNEHCENHEKQLILRLLEESMPESTETIIAFRGNQRLVQTFEPIRLEKVKLPPSRLKPKGVYLITGGLGGIGLELAKYLAASVKARLILTGISTIPLRKDWDQWLENHEKNDPISSKIRKLMELERMGGEFLIFNADVSDKQRMQEVIYEAEKKLGKLNGIIHSAGIADGALIDQMTTGIIKRVFRPKVKGTLVLDDILKNKDMDLDFFVLCSSINSIKSSPGEATYCSANTFLDAYALFKNSRDGIFTCSINWNAWQEVGMTVNLVKKFTQTERNSSLMGFGITRETLNSISTLQKSLLKNGLSNSEGTEVFQRILSVTTPQVVISTVELRTFPEKSNVWEIPQSIPKTPRLGLTMPYIAPGNRVEKLLANIWENILGIKKIGIHDDFFELGGNSLKAISLNARIKKEMDINLPPAKILQLPTIRRLSEYINENRERNKYIPMEIVEKKEYYPLSSPQKGLYILHQLDAASTAYNIPQIVLLEGEIKEDKFKDTFTKLIHRHESLRTSFPIVNEEPVQKIHHECEFKIEYYEKTINKKALLIDDENSFLINGFTRPFNLSRVPLFRVGLIKIQKEKQILMVDMHHIISDGTSVDILIKDFMALYEGEKLPLPGLQYKDFSEWRNRCHKEKSIKQQQAYWINEYKNNITVLNLPTDYSRPMVQSFEGSTLSFEMDKETTRALKKYAAEAGKTLYILLLSIHTIFLSKISNQEDIIIGTPATGRRHPGIENIIGMFVNTLVMRNYPIGDMPFDLFLDDVKTRTIKVFANQDYPYDDLVEVIGIDRDTSHNPVFDTMFAWENLELPEIETPGLKLKSFFYKSMTSKFDLTLTATEKRDILYFSFEYSTKLFKAETIEQFITYFKKVLYSALENPEIKLSKIEIISNEEKRKILNDFNNTASGYPRDKAVQQLFEEKVERTPDNIALVGSGHYSLQVCHTENMHITYRELNQRSNQLARLLRKEGIKTDSVVGLLIGPCVQIIIGIMGILKAGGYYSPIAPNIPAGRFEYMVKDAAVSVLLTHNETAGKIVFKGKKINLDQDALFKGSTSNPDYCCQSNNLAYALYTSGSTGQPKGVAVEHSQLVNFVYHMYNRYDCNIDSHDRCLSLTNIMFDVSLWEFFLTLSFGARLVLLSEQKRFDVFALSKAILQYEITLIYLPPSLLKPVNEVLKKECSMLRLNKMLVGVEPIRDKELEDYFQLNNQMRIINGYGPTETTICASSLNYISNKSEGKIVPIGVPLANNQIVLLDAVDHVVPCGIPGEIYISGDGVSRGYLNNPELTAEKYTLSPYFEGKRMYRTGDLARWLPNGNIEFFGRIDHQVKIRGFRIELGEIEFHLLTHELIKEAFVAAREEKSGEKYLCAYFVPHSPESSPPLLSSELRIYLSGRLPNYMIPSYFVKLDEMPLTPNGKIDMKALLKPEITVSTEEYEAPDTWIELKLTDIWSDVLGIEKEKISINANFFEMGGHSLKATVLISKIHKTFNVNMPLIEIFTSPTIFGLSNYIKEAAKEKYISIEPAEKKEYYPLAYAQKRLFVLHQMDEQEVGYNLPSFSILEGEIYMDRLENTFNRLIIRHESLRTSFSVIKEEAVQIIHSDVEFEIEYFDIVTEGTDGEKKKLRREEDGKIRVERFIRPFDLTKAPLIRVVLIKIEKEKHIFLVDMHHIVSDGISVEVLIEDFTSLYSGKELRGINLHYKDYANHQNREKAGQNHLKQGAYWRKEFEGEIPVLDFPTDYAKPAIKSFEGNSINFEINGEASEALNSFALKTGTTLYMMLLTLYSILLSKISGREDIIIGTPVSGRRHSDLERTIGMFVNTLALRNYPSGEKTFTGFLQEVKYNTLKAFENQDYQYEELVEQSTINRDISRNPLFDTMFVLQNTGLKAIDIPGLRMVPYEYENKTSKFDLTLIGLEVEDKMLFTFEYSTKLFREETIQRFIGYFKKIISEVLNYGKEDIKLSEIKIISEEEKKRILFDFNDTETDYPKDKTILQLFEEQVEKSSDHIAVIGASLPSLRNVQLTYKELNKKCNQLASILRKQGVEPDSIAGIMIERSIEMIIGLLGILKAGGAYLPIEPDYPKERIDFMLKDSGAGLVLTHEFIIQATKITQPTQLTHPHHLAYIIYTSGSTGKPKGVLIEHGNVVRLLFNDKFAFDFTDRDVWTMFHSYSFDFSVWEMYGALLYGGKLVLISQITARDTRWFREVLKTQNVTVLNQTPAVFYNLVEVELAETKKELTLKYIIFGGEALNPFKLKEWKEKYPRVKLINMYGITETTVHVTYKEITAHDIELAVSNIGKPIPTTVTYVLDRNKKLVPTGITGELYVGGEGAARGYLNRVELTFERFERAVINHLSLVNNKLPGHFLNSLSPNDQYPMTNDRLYKTGDLGRWFSNGELEYQGRIDNQVKIRGYRIETGEIESQLAKHKEIKEAVVIPRESASDRYLCAYIVTRRNLTGTELREYLKLTLPNYMIPVSFVCLDKIPLTANGKVDRDALPRPGTGIESDYVAPGNETQHKLTWIWQNVLALERVGITDNYFNIGGDSIKAIKLLNSINRTFKIDLKIAHLFTSQTIEELSQQVEKERGSLTREGLKDTVNSIDALKARLLREYPQLRDPDIEDIYPMSDIEKGMVFHSLKEPERAVYHDQMVYQARYVDFDPGRFKQALTLMVEKHLILRTGLHTGEFGNREEGIQLVHKRVSIDIRHEDISQLEKKDKEAFIKKYMAADRQTPINVTEPPLWRMRTFLIDKDNVVILFIFHHAILDGWSNASFNTELHNLYLTLKTDPDFVPVKLKSSYKEFIIEQEANKKRKEVYEYWKNELAGSSRLEFPVPVQTSRAPVEMRRHHVDLGTGILKRLQEKGKEYNISLKHLCFAAYLYMLYMLSYENDIVVGLVTHNRPVCKDGEKILGCFLNTIPVRLKIPVNIKWVEYIRLVDKKLVELKKYDRLSLHEIVKLAGKNTQGQNPVFDTFFNFVDFHIYGEAHLVEEVLKIENNANALDVTSQETTNTFFDFTINASLKKFTASITYSIAILSERDVLKVFDYFKTVLSKFIDEIEGNATKESFLSKEEKKRILYDFNDTAAGFSTDKTIHRLFAQQVERTPDHIALVGTKLQNTNYTKNYNISVTYRELNKKSDRLARILCEKGVEPGTIVGIMVARSLEMIIGIMGILKAGAAYLPIDPEYPEERINYMLADSAAKILVTSPEVQVKAEVEERFIEIIDISNLSSFSTLPSTLTCQVSHANLAYVIYTSGSTGKPKGVILQHRNLVNLLLFQQRYTNIDSSKILQYATISFDASFHEIFTAFLSGGQLVLVDKETGLNIPLLFDLIAKNAIKTVFLPISFLKLIFSDNEYVKQVPGCITHIQTAGEQVVVSDEFKRYLKEKGIYLHNHYGPSETHVVTTYTIDPAGEIPGLPPIGWPVSNTLIYILDKGMHLVPVGIPGELFIGGLQVGMGYLNRPELTAEKFIEIEVEFLRGGPGGAVFTKSAPPGRRRQKLYKTGDLASWQPDGNIEFLGRIDHQIKIRGFRIELGEIETQLLKHELIKETVVTAREEMGERYLCAYFVTGASGKSHASISSEVRAFLSKRLPGYMIPSYFVPMDRFPLTPNGKIDRKALPDPVIAAGEGFIAPRNGLEKKLAKIWSELLSPTDTDQESIGIDDNFFHLGGHSLKATILISKIRNNMNVDAPLVEVFKKPTIRQLAEYILENTDDSFMLRDERVFLLKKGSGNTNSLFFIHDGTGEVEGYIEFCNHLDNEFDCLGIRPDELKNYTPQNIALEEIAGKYVEKIKKVQSKGPYFIAGWSLGGTIAFEMVKQLEETGEKTALLALFDSPGPGMHPDQANNEFTLQSEVNDIREYLPDSKIIKIMENVTALEELWPAIIAYLKESHAAVDTFKKVISEHGIPGFNDDRANIEELIYDLNVTRTLLKAREKYIPSIKVKTGVHYFEASGSKETINRQWDEYCTVEAKYYTVPGDHFSMFKNPHVEKLALIFQGALEGIWDS